MAQDTTTRPATVLQARGHKANTEEAIAAHLTRFEADTGMDVRGVIVARDDDGRIAVAITAGV